MNPTEERGLNDDEVRLVRWLLENGEQGAASYLSSMDELRIVWTCDCGCASVGFIRGAVGPMEILADFGLKSGSGGVLLFARGDKLSRLEVYSYDDPIVSLPAPCDLVALPAK